MPVVDEAGPAQVCALAAVQAEGGQRALLKAQFQVVGQPVTQQKVDQEIRSILDQQYALSRRLLEENKAKVELMANTLLDWETIDADQINDIMEGREPRPPKAGLPVKKPTDSGGGVAPTATAPA